MVNNKNIYFLVSGVFLLKLMLLPFSQTTDADAVSRIFLSIQWLENPVWIKTDVWGPFHYYLNGAGLYLWENRVIMPKLINVVFSCLTLLPFYFFTRREFNKEGAFFSTLLLAFCPILFRTSFMALSNTPFILLLALSLNELSKARQHTTINHYILSGLFITLAAGFRYEAWLIMAIFAGMLFSYKLPKQALIYSCFALIFPIVWMTSNFLETGDAMYSINGNYTWTHEVMGVNDNLHWKEYIKRIGFFPYSWVLMIGPFAAYLILKYGVIAIKNKEKNQLFWGIPGLTIFIFMVVNSYQGNLLNQHRFIGTIVLFSLPFFALFFNEYTSQKRNLTLLFLAITVGFSFFEIGLNKGGQPFPRVKEKFCYQINNLLEEQEEENEYLILDFLSWESTYNIALNSRYHPSKIYIQEGAKNSRIDKQNLWKKIEESEKGLVVYKENSIIHQFINSEIERLELKKISSLDDIMIVQLRKREN